MVGFYSYSIVFKNLSFLFNSPQMPKTSLTFFASKFEKHKLKEAELASKKKKRKHRLCY